MAEDRDAGVDLVRMRQAGAAHPPLLALAPVHEELELEIALLAGAGAVVAEGGAMGIDGGGQNPLHVDEQLCTR